MYSLASFAIRYGATFIAIRVSSDKQGLDGDSPEAQHEQGKAYAKADNIIIIETIILLESASHETQPMQKVIDVCKDKSKGFQVVLIKSIDRFTRGGGDYYSPLKRQLTRLGIALDWQAANKHAGAHWI